MQTQALSTAEVLALRTLGRSVDEKWVEWAVCTLVEGYDSPSLRILAGESRPFNQFEMAALVDRIFEELGLRQFGSQAEAAVVYASVRARHLLDGVVPVDVALAEISQMCTDLDYLSAIYDFYLLRFAREDLQTDEVQWYWPDGNRENIDELIKEYCRKWIGDHPLDV